MTKANIRTRIKALKSKLTDALIQSYSEALVNTFIKSPEYMNSNQLFCYVSFNQEIITTGLIKSALRDNKRVAVPKVMGDDMKFFYISSLKDLELGNFGILEPCGKEEALLSEKEENLIIVPGLAFDQKGNRIGYGKGFFDTFFLQHQQYLFKKIAFAYAFQVFEEIPTEEHDIKIDEIIYMDM